MIGLWREEQCSFLEALLRLGVDFNQLLMTEFTEMIQAMNLRRRDNSA